MVRLAESGVQESLLGFVILGCEWMFRLRTSQSHDAETVLARIESRLLPVLHEHAWLVAEALAPLIRKLLKTQRVLAPEWEDVPREVLVVTEPKSSDDPYHDVGYVAPLRMRPEPLIRARRGPTPKLAPWISGAVAERLMGKQKADNLTPGEEDSIVEFVSALCDRAIDKQEYVVRRRSLQVQELDNLVERFESSHDLFVSWDSERGRGDRPDWFRVVRARLERFGPRDTFPYGLPTVTGIVHAYGTAPAVHRASSARAAAPKSPRSGRRRSG